MNEDRFKIETVKWSWAPEVKNPSVYRDDELIRTKTKEEALDAIDFLMGRPQGLTYTITVFKEGEYLTYWRHSMPCYGGLVKYRDSHGERYFMNPYFPRDIRVAFPEGEIVFISCHYNKQDSALDEFLLSQESPWVSAFGSKDTIIFKDKHFILTNMNTDPTVFYHFMKYSRFGSGIRQSSSYSKWDPKAQILATMYTQADPRRIAAQKPIRISGGTWAEGYGYTRPYNESIFKTSIPTPLKDFGKVSGAENSVLYDFTTDYFVTEMKKFGLSVGYGFTADEKSESALLEAWDYFKEQASSLSDEPGIVG